jgi:hypothetical protein
LRDLVIDDRIILECMTEDLWTLVQDWTGLYDLSFSDMRLTHFGELFPRPQNAGDILRKVRLISTDNDASHGFIWFEVLCGRSDFVDNVMKLPLQNMRNSSTS